MLTYAAVAGMLTDAVVDAEPEAATELLAVACLACSWWSAATGASEVDRVAVGVGIGNSSASSWLATATRTEHSANSVVVNRMSAVRGFESGCEGEFGRVRG